jgi:hypothetical protein
VTWRATQTVFAARVTDTSVSPEKKQEIVSVEGHPDRRLELARRIAVFLNTPAQGGEEKNRR